MWKFAVISCVNKSYKIIITMSCLPSNLFATASVYAFPVVCTDLTIYNSTFYCITENPFWIWNLRIDKYGILSFLLSLPWNDLFLLSLQSLDFLLQVKKKNIFHNYSYNSFPKIPSRTLLSNTYSALHFKIITCPPHGAAHSFLFMYVDSSWCYQSELIFFLI